MFWYISFIIRQSKLLQSVQYNLQNSYIIFIALRQYQITQIGYKNIKLEMQQNSQNPQCTNFQNTTSSNSNNMMQTMTSVMKHYKLILHYLQLQFRTLSDNAAHSNGFISNFYVSHLQGNISNDTSSTSSSNHLANHNNKLDQSIKFMQKTANLIKESNPKKILTNRLINRLLQITSLYRNKCAQIESTYELRDHLNVIYGLIKEYQCQTCWQGMYGQTNSSTNHNSLNGMNSLLVESGANPQVNNYNFQFVGLFNKICWVFKKCTKQLKQKLIKIYQDNSLSKSVFISSNIIVSATSSPLNSSISHFKQRQKQKQKQRQRQRQKQRQRQRQKEKQKQRKSQVQIPAKSLQYKYKITKQVIGNTGLFNGMDIDITHLKSLFYQIRNNLNETIQDKLSANQMCIKARDQYLSMYNQYKQKIKRKNLKREKLLKSGNSSPIKARNSQNKVVMYSQKNTSFQLNSASSKMPKILQINQNNYQGVKQKQENRKFQHFKNIQFLAFNRQFIQLSQIKNQKIARRPYAQVKQVLVAGDQINYYSNKNHSIQSSSHCNKASFFMQRVIVKNDKILIKKKSAMESSRLATEQ